MVNKLVILPNFLSAIKPSRKSSYFMLFFHPYGFVPHAKLSILFACEGTCKINELDNFIFGCLSNYLIGLETWILFIIASTDTTVSCPYGFPLLPWSSLTIHEIISPNLFAIDNRAQTCWVNELQFAQ